MSHSHMPVKHLLKQVEIYKNKRRTRDRRPTWVTDFINEVAELFEPLRDVGRVGFDCQLAQDRWILAMYLGSTELVGGKHDGQARHTNFQFDLSALTEIFDSISQFCWDAFPDGADDDSSNVHSLITVEGTIGTHPVILRLYSVPPTDAGPGFRQYPDGRCHTV